MSFANFLYNQLILKLPYPTGSYKGKTVIVTGSNVGLGKEAARHFTRLGASAVILAVRSLDKGNAAKADIEQTTGCAKSIVQVWQLDMANYDSVKNFAARAEKELERVDMFLANAGVATAKFRLVEGTESMVTVNVIATFLLALLMMPKLKETAKKFNTTPTLTITTSEVHASTKFQEKAAPDGEIFATMNDAAKFNVRDRYPVSKLLEILGVRALAKRYPADSLAVTVNCVNPGDV